MKKALLIAVGVLLVSSSVNAIPRVQVYIAGGSYVGDTWRIENNNFTVRVANAWNGQDARNPQSRDVYLAISTPKGETGTIWINGVALVSDTPSFLDQASPGFANHDPNKDWNMSFYHIGMVSADGTTVDYMGPVPGTSTALGHEDDLAVVVEGFSRAHFDALAKENPVYNNPYSHDGEMVPEPGTLALLGTGLLGLIPAFRKRRKK